MNFDAFKLVPVLMCIANCLSVDSAFAQDATTCVTIASKDHKPQCGGQNDMKMVFGNGCFKPIEVKFCLQRMNGTANCGLHTIRPGKETSTWGCNVTGKYWYAARVEGSNMNFLNESEINWNIR